MSNNSDTTKAVIVASAVGGLVGGAAGALAAATMLKASETGDEFTSADTGAQQRKDPNEPKSLRTSKKHENLGAETTASADVPS